LRRNLTGGADPRDCPYVGLDPFEKGYERFFFGREGDSLVIADHVSSRPITVLFGPSGVGKSSVLNVGLPAALCRRRPWVIVTLREWQESSAIGQSAFAALRAMLPVTGKISQRRARSPSRVLDALRATKRPLLLILDQFEEYFLYRNNKAAVTSGEEALGALLSTSDLDMRLLIALRDDSLHLLDNLRATIPGVLETTVRLGHLNDAAAERAIRGPIRVYNEIYRQGAAAIEVEDRLVATLINKLRQGDGRPITGAGSPPGSEAIELPYLQLTMTKLWAMEGGRKARRLRLETLTAKLGGVQEIARNHVDDILSELTPKEQSLCAEIFRYLVTAGAGKIAYPTRDLTEQINEYYKQSGESGVDEIVPEEDVIAVLRKLARTETRLVKQVTTKGLAAFELFHDVLGQPVLRWRRAFSENVRLHAEQLRREERRAFESFLTAIRQTDDSSARSAFQALPALAAVLSDARANTAVDIVLMEIKKAASPELLQSLAEALQALPASRTDAQVAIESILAVIRKTTDPFAFQSLAQALHFLHFNLTEAQVRAATDSILAAINKTTTKLQLESLMQALQALIAQLTDALVQVVVESNLAAIKQTTDPFVFQSRERALRALVAKLTDVQVQSAAESVLTAIRQTTDPLTLEPLARALVAFPAEPTHALAQGAIEFILAAMEQTTDPFTLESLARALAVLDAKLTEAQARAAVESVLTAIRQTTDPSTLEPLARALVALPAKPTHAQVQGAVEFILAAIKQVPDGSDNKSIPSRARALQPLTLILQTLAVNFTKAQARAAFDSIMAAIMHTDDLLWLDPLARVLPTLAPKLTNADAQAAAESILAAIRHTTDPFALQSLARAFPALSGKVTDTQATAATESILTAIMQTDNPFALGPLAEALRALPSKLTDAQSQAAVEAIFAAIKNAAGDREKVESVLRASQALAPKLTEAKADVLLKLMRPFLALVRM
jgi:hypothetical protein